MKKPLQVGITGGIGAGKSLVTKIFHTFGVPVYDADTRAKSLMTTDAVLIAQIKKEFGDQSYFADGSINRPVISAAAFGAAGKADVLNRLVHPRVAVDYENWVRLHESNHYVVKEAALLFEAGSYAALDKIIVVTAPEALRVKRVLQRDPQRSLEEVQNIIRRQLPQEEKASRADYVLVNDEVLPLLPQVLALHATFSVAE